MKRREFIALIGGTAAAWPLAARAQQPGMPVIGFLRNTSPAGSAPVVATLRKGLNESGYIEGKNVRIEYRWSEGDDDRLPELAADLVQHHCSVIIGGGSAAALAAKKATTTIPIVFSTGDDPIQLGLVASLNRPSGNVTGVFFYSGGILISKQLELLHQLLPNGSSVGILVNPMSPISGSQDETRRRQHPPLGSQQLHILNAGSERDIDAAFVTLTQNRGDALLNMGNALFFGYRDRIIDLAARYKVPAIYDVRHCVAAGGLMSYGASITDAYRQAGVYVARILNGTKPSDLPVLVPTKYELIINLKTAKTLGLDIPDRLLALTDEVIE
jgi:putative tryptophan/tyrosine transport system substrate-binding protein